LAGNSCPENRISKLACIPDSGDSIRTSQKRWATSTPPAR